VRERARKRETESTLNYSATEKERGLRDREIQSNATQQAEKSAI
jgi:hypothetical protein